MSGYMLYNGGAGNLFNGGDVDGMYDMFVRELTPLPDMTLLFPGHDYMKTNLNFAASCEPLNDNVGYWQGQVERLSADEMPYMTLGQERQYNPFLRLASSGLLPQLQGGNERETFKALRAKRDAW